MKLDGRRLKGDCRNCKCKELFARSKKRCYALYYLERILTKTRLSQWMSGLVARVLKSVKWPQNSWRLGRSLDLDIELVDVWTLRIVLPVLLIIRIRIARGISTIPGIPHTWLAKGSLWKVQSDANQKWWDLDTSIIRWDVNANSECIKFMWKSAEVRSIDSVAEVQSEVDDVGDDMYEFNPPLC